MDPSTARHSPVCRANLSSKNHHDNNNNFDNNNNSAEVQLAAVHALYNSLEFVKENFAREVSIHQS
jgi:hypothetical protein